MTTTDALLAQPKTLEGAPKMGFAKPASGQEPVQGLPQQKRRACPVNELQQQQQQHQM